LSDDFYFSGDTYEPDFDKERLSSELYAVRRLMTDGSWRTLSEIREAIGIGSEAGISARLRDLRKNRFGAHTINRRRRGEAKDGLFEYQFIKNSGPLWHFDTDGKGALF
jgi:hypothetical protein